MTPVAALIVVRPGVEVNAVERDALYADSDRWNLRTHFPVEPILIHAEIRRSIPKAYESGRARRPGMPRFRVESELRGGREFGIRTYDVFGGNDYRLLDGHGSSHNLNCNQDVTRTTKANPAVSSIL
jgi:hypothetical protein